MVPRCLAFFVAFNVCLLSATADDAKPNVILVMADDLGWGDTGYNGHGVLATPSLDAMAASGLRFDRFYAAAPVCSPTRGSCLTGRHPFRYGIKFANVGHLPQGELTLAEALRGIGYTTGHFGKWHLGTLSKTQPDGNRGGPRGSKNYSPPWSNGFDVSFSTEVRVPTWNPMLTPPKGHGGVTAKQVPGEPFGGAYWTGPEQKAEKNLEGDDSRIIMDRAIPFIEKAAGSGTPFFAVVWFHAPHLPVVAGPEDLAKYPTGPLQQRHYFGCITALDRQVGRLRRKIRELGIAKNTMVWFCSDNGPEGRAGRAPGSAGPLRGRKRSLLEGGIRVPAILEWPARIPRGRATSVPCGTSDYLPTVLGAVGIEVDATSHPVDGISLMPLVDGRMKSRGSPMGFESQGQVAWMDDRFKLYRPKPEKPFQLYDLLADPGESRDMAGDESKRVADMAAALSAWQASR